MKAYGMISISRNQGRFDLNAYSFDTEFLPVLQWSLAYKNDRWYIPERATLRAVRRHLPGLEMVDGCDPKAAVDKLMAAGYWAKPRQLARIFAPPEAQAATPGKVTRTMTPDEEAGWIARFTGNGLRVELVLSPA